MGKHVATEPDRLNTFNADWHPRTAAPAAAEFALATEPLEEWVAEPFEAEGTPAPSDTLQQILRGSMAANFTELLGFDAWSAALAPDEEASVQRIMVAATTHPDFEQFERYELGEESADHDAVNDLAYVILRDTLAKLHVTA
jgi:hypothetical protein